MIAPNAHLVVESCYDKVFKTGSVGFGGKLIDPGTGKRYQITAVEIGSKPKPSS